MHLPKGFTTSVIQLDLESNFVPRCKLIKFHQSSKAQNAALLYLFQGQLKAVLPRANVIIKFLHSATMLC